MKFDHEYVVYVSRQIVDTVCAGNDINNALVLEKFLRYFEQAGSVQEYIGLNGLDSYFIPDTLLGESIAKLVREQLRIFSKACTYKLSTVISNSIVKEVHTGGTCALDMIKQLDSSSEVDQAVLSKESCTTLRNRTIFINKGNPLFPWTKEFNHNINIMQSTYYRDGDIVGEIFFERVSDKSALGNHIYTNYIGMIDGHLVDSGNSLLLRLATFILVFPIYVNTCEQTSCSMIEMLTRIQRGFNPLTIEQLDLSFFQSVVNINMNRPIHNTLYGLVVTLNSIRKKAKSRYLDVQIRHRIKDIESC